MKSEKTTVYSSELYDSVFEGTDEIAHEIITIKLVGTSVIALDAIAFDLKINGSKELAQNMCIIDDTNESTIIKLTRTNKELEKVIEKLKVLQKILSNKINNVRRDR